MDGLEKTTTMIGMSGKGPMVDVVIPAYNAERFIAATMRSVLAQTRPPTTLIVVDDGSTDRTLQVMQEERRNYRGDIHIEVLTKENGGQSTARNLGMDIGSSPYIGLLDADDLWLPHKLEQQIEVFENGPEDLGLVYTGHVLIDADGNELPRPAQVNMPHGSIFKELLKANLINASASSALVKRECLDRVGGFDPELRAIEDWDLWLRIGQHFRIDRVESPCVAIRQHMSMQGEARSMLTNLLIFFKKWFPVIANDLEVQRIWGHLIAEFILRSKDIREAQEHVEQQLSKEMKAAFFRRTFGSLRLYLRLKQLRRSLPS